MAKLISYKRRDENRYSTFSNVSFGASNDNLSFKTMPKKAKSSAAAVVSPAVHKKYEKRSPKKPRKRKRWISWTCCFEHKWIRRTFCCPCLCCYRMCRKSKKGNLSNDDDIDKAFEEYKQQQGIAGEGSAKSTIESKMDTGKFWSWNETWKTDSDKFLESLELDGVGSDETLKRKLRQKNKKVRMSAFHNFYLGGGSVLWTKHEKFWRRKFNDETFFIWYSFRRNASLGPRKFTGNWKSKCHRDLDAECRQPSRVTCGHHHRSMACAIWRRHRQTRRYASESTQFAEFTRGEFGFVTRPNIDIN